PMLLAVIAVLLVLDSGRGAQVLLQAPSGSVPLRIEHPLIALREGVLHISGVPEGAAERVELAVRHDGLAAELLRKVIARRIARVRVIARVPAPTPPGAQVLTIDQSWSASLTLTSDYWQK